MTEEVKEDDGTGTAGGRGATPPPEDHLGIEYFAEPTCKILNRDQLQVKS
jgi:hypothetical protein